MSRRWRALTKRRRDQVRARQMACAGGSGDKAASVVKPVVHFLRRLRYRPQLAYRQQVDIVDNSRVLQLLARSRAYCRVRDLLPIGQLRAERSRLPFSSAATSRSDSTASESELRAACCPCRLPSATAYGRRSEPTGLCLSSLLSDHRCDPRILRIEAQRIGDPQRDELAVDERVHAVEQVAGSHRHIASQAQCVVLVHPRVVAGLDAELRQSAKPGPGSRWNVQPSGQ